MPLFGRQLELVFKQQLLELVRSEMVSRQELESGLPDAETINVSFSDLVGFTKMGEELPPEEIGRVAGRLGELAADVATGPVQLVKTIGDAAMLVSPDAEALVRVTLDLVKAADDEGEDFPMLRAGVARGEAIGRGGDWYGRPVNVASRLTGVARPGSVLTTEAVHDEAEDAFDWSFAGRKKLKGVKEPLPLFRARRSPKADACVIDKRASWQGILSAGPPCRSPRSSPPPCPAFLSAPFLPLFAVAIAGAAAALSPPAAPRPDSGPRGGRGRPRPTPPLCHPQKTRSPPPGDVRFRVRARRRFPRVRGSEWGHGELRPAHGCLQTHSSGRSGQRPIGRFYTDALRSRWRFRRQPASVHGGAIRSCRSP